MKNNLKSFTNILKLDLMSGFNSYKKKLIVFLILMLILIIGNISALNSFNGSLSDLFFAIYKDVLFDKKTLNIPINWVIINIFIIFILGDFISENIKKDSNYVLLRSKKISLYWISKCTWIILNVVFIYLILMLMTYFLGGIILGFNMNNGNLIHNEIATNVNNLTIVISTIAIYISTSIALLFIQCVLSIVTNSRYSFLLTTILLAMSIVSKNKFLIGVHSMILRHNYFDTEMNISISFSIIYTTLISVILIILGYNLLKHKDFI